MGGTAMTCCCRHEGPNVHRWVGWLLCKECLLQGSRATYSAVQGSDTVTVLLGWKNRERHI